MNYFIIILLILHIILCTSFLILRIMKLLKFSYISIFIAFFIPIWGELMLLVKWLFDESDRQKGDPLDVRRIEIETEKKSITLDRDAGEVVPLAEALIVNNAAKRKEIMMDILYDINNMHEANKSVAMEEDTEDERVVPLEEALIVNDTATRRNLIIDVLYSNPGDYVMQLNNAKENNDTEVVHYAATALTEIQKDFDLRFQDIAKRLAESPDNLEINNEYQSLLEKYIASGLLEGPGLKTQLRKYSDLLRKKISHGSVKGLWSLINKKAEADLKLEDTIALDEDIKIMERHWPTRENVYIFKIKNAVLNRDRTKVEQIIKEVNDSGMHQSFEFQSMIKFWSEQGK